MRKERDSLGEAELPDDALYSLQSFRAHHNFSLNYKPVHKRLIRAMAFVKKAAAVTWGKLGVKQEIYRAVEQACDMLIADLNLPDGGPLAGQFIVDALQGGAGTSLNMNVNEVLANLALQILGKASGDYAVVHPLDDVNRGQSTNDVYPTALRIAAVELLRETSGECAKLQEALQKKETEFAGVKKLGRTELMDAVPITLGEEFGAYAQAIARDRWRLYKAEERLRQVNIGGAAVGLTVNTDSVSTNSANSDSVNTGRKYRFGIIEELRELTGIGLASAEYPMDITQNNDVFVEVSGLLKSLAVNLMKIANDFRLMNSGPCGGLGEISLAPLQRGSTIMPGKVNPVIPEMVIQTAIRVQANDYAIAMAASHGEFELNAFIPLIADSILESLSLLCRALEIFRTKCVVLLSANRERCAALLDGSFAFAASYLARLGYDEVSRVIEEHRNDPGKAREVLEGMSSNTTLR
jgi:aspartate ammonia-lyase